MWAARKLMKRSELFGNIDVNDFEIPQNILTL
jgi:hypothetical protein